MTLFPTNTYTGVPMSALLGPSVVMIGGCSNDPLIISGVLSNIEKYYKSMINC